jgi:hypothetical protein
VLARPPRRRSADAAFQQHPRHRGQQGDVRATASPWSTAAQQEPKSIVVEVPEPEAEALDVLDHQVGALGGGVGEPGGVRSGRTPLTTCPPHTRPRDSATAAWPTPAPPGGPPAADHAPSPAGGRVQPPAPHRPRTRRARPWSRSPATTRHWLPQAATRSPRTRRARPARTRRYRRVASGASCRCCRRTAASIARPLSAPADPLSLRAQRARPHASSRRAV